MSEVLHAASRLHGKPGKGLRQLVAQTEARQSFYKARSSSSLRRYHFRFAQCYWELKVHRQGERRWLVTLVNGNCDSRGLRSGLEKAFVRLHLHGTESSESIAFSLIFVSSICNSTRCSANAAQAA
ncbi:hypothetical protein CBR_g8289 [Chara braunii]|uniref:Uncharacterized protein n=1 Tax=Chara braunii TaxID=69332 RepID=A0A388KLR7_CHABU|nr:hypothetical protein CBR_g8289 [Chara braunii]|eukprot:GBG70990.1 hypothetical protein CBR_g8289 [Chara braunii]